MPWASARAALVRPLLEERQEAANVGHCNSAVPSAVFDEAGLGQRAPERAVHDKLDRLDGKLASAAGLDHTHGQARGVYSRYPLDQTGIRFWRRHDFEGGELEQKER